MIAFAIFETLTNGKRQSVGSTELRYGRFFGCTAFCSGGDRVGVGNRGTREYIIPPLPLGRQSIGYSET